MIPRYEKQEISSLWSEENKFSTYLKVELAIMKAQEGHGKRAPIGSADKIQELSKIDPKRIEEIEKETKHDMIAFCTSITENLPEDLGKFFHFGVTSSDIIDSALTLQIKESLEQILPEFKKVLKTLKKVAIEHKMTMCMGRSHGMYAEPMSFGQKFLGHFNELSRRFQEFVSFYENDLTVQFSGAVGNYTILTPEMEQRAADILGVSVEPSSTQVIPRDRIAKLISINALIASAIERLAVEIRHLHRSDVFELHEGFSKGQKGSSTMPHKKNPISGENLTGMARLLRSHLSMALENIVLWHERDISHSSTERMYLPDNLGILLYSLKRLNSTLENLQIHKEDIQRRVLENYSYLSSYYLHFLIERVSLKREDLYLLVQSAAFEAQKSQDREIFHKTLQKLLNAKQIDVTLPSPSDSELRKIFLGHVDSVFERSFEKYNL